ncbi:MAG: dTMP kinase [Candidatus Aenigmarchaeota archaeon]|nr:dTMP kinase [Candidatus Aenigmarchaeota archaeon]
MQGKFICFEGLDGSGITTQATLLRNSLTEEDKEAVLTKEPSDGLIGGTIKACLRHEWKTDQLTLQMLFAADRSHHLATEIEPALKKGKTIICDRYVLSSLAFGGMSLSVDAIKQLNTHFRKPHLTIFVDTQPKICIQRMKKARHHVEMFEEEQKLVQIRNNYLGLKNFFPNTVVVDGNKKPEEIHAEIRKIVKGLP